MYAAPEKSAVATVTASLAARLALLAGWAIVVAYLLYHHVVWRDEVRAFSLALTGDTVPAMLRAIHGEGHPALWYLLLRGLHALLPHREVLGGLALAIAAAAAALFALRAPFGAGRIAIVLFSAFAAYDYPVVARNYGIAMLLTFAFVALYARHRYRPWLLGVVLLLLMNTCVHAGILAGGLLLFWAIELVCERRAPGSPQVRGWAIAALLAAIGALLCVLVIYPPANDAARTAWPPGLGWRMPVMMILGPGNMFDDLAPHWLDPTQRIMLVTVLLWGSLFAFVRVPAAFVVAVAALLGFTILFTFVYIGGYRHQALLLVLFVALSWLVAEGRGGRWDFAGRLLRLERLGCVMLTLLLALQIPDTVRRIAHAEAGIPESRSRDLAEMLRARGLGGAILLADPDYLLEPMPYYATNPLYLTREQRFGHVFRLSRVLKAHTIGLDLYLDTARRLRAAWNRPVVILLQRPLGDIPVGQVWQRGSYSPLLITADARARFFDATVPLAFFEPAEVDESYQAYLFRGP